MPKLTPAVLARYQRELDRDGYLTLTVSAGNTVAIHRRTQGQGWRVLTTKRSRLTNSREFHERATVEQMLGHGLSILSDERRA